MLVIYLDQCAISSLVRDADSSHSISALRALLLDGVQRNDLICPIPDETLLESAGMQHATREQMWDLHLKLAANHLAFKNYWQLVREETIAIARSEAPPFWLQMVNFKSLSDHALARTISEQVTEAKKEMKNRVAGGTFQKASPDAVLMDIVESVLKQQVSHVYRQVCRLIEGKVPDPSDHMALDLATALQKEQLSQAELGRIVEELLSRRWEQIPVIFYRGLLVAQCEIESSRVRGDPRGYKVNDEFDIPRLAVGLGYANLILTDRPMVELCRATKMEEFSDCKVGTLTEPDEALETVKRLLAAAR